MNIDKIKSLENDPDIVKKYIGLTSFGKNKSVYVPYVIGVLLLATLLLLILTGILGKDQMLTIAIMVLGLILCFVAVRLITNETKKKLLAENSSIPLSIAKKILGNEKAKKYYCIYTNGEKRHDSDFINTIAHKIMRMIEEPQGDGEKQIATFFRERFSKPNEPAELLPVDLTDDVMIWRREFSLSQLPENQQKQIDDNDGQFVVATIVPENAKMVTECFEE